MDGGAVVAVSSPGSRRDGASVLGASAGSLSEPLSPGFGSKHSMLSGDASRSTPVPVGRGSSGTSLQLLDTNDLHAVDTSAADIDEEVEVPRDDKWFSWRLLWAYTGPGWLMSIAYLDPGNLESDLQAGAFAGYSLLWVLFWSTALGLLLQVLAARLGVTTGKHLAQVCRAKYPRPVYLTLWLMTEIAIVGSDIQEVLGSAIAIKILFGLPLWVGCLITGLDTFTFLALGHLGVRKLEAFVCVLILTMTTAFFVTFAMSDPPGLQLAGGLFIPEMKSYAVLQGVGILGSVIMPHNIYLHSALVLSRKVDRRHAGRVAEAIKYNTIESAMALAVSFLINAAVVAVFAQGFFVENCAILSEGTKAWVDGTCKPIGLLNAGEALEGVLGNAAKYVWAIGLLAAGQSSTMTGTFAGQHVMSGFLNIEIHAWKRTFFTRAVALGPAIAVAVIAQGHTDQADTLDEWLNVLQSVQLPFALLPVLKFTSMKEVMGPFASGHVTKLIVWLMALLVMGINVYLIRESADALLPHSWWVYLIIAVLAVLYFGFIFFIVLDELLVGVRALRDGIVWVLRCGRPPSDLSWARTRLVDHHAGANASESYAVVPVK